MSEEMVREIAYLFSPLLNKYTLNLCKSDLGTFIKLYILSTFCCCCPSGVPLCSSSAINCALVAHSGLQQSNHSLVKLQSLHPHCIHAQLNAGKATASYFVRTE